MVESHTPEYPAFDWLRIILASYVYFAHADLVGWTYAGDFAVQVFFALSGWLIGGILLDTTPAKLPRFYYNRVTRIWLPYFLAVGLLYTATILKDGGAPYFFEVLAFDLTFTHNWFIEKIPTVIEAMPMQGTGSHFWSIAVEEQFYLFAPLLLVLVPVTNSIVLWSILAAIAVFTQSFYGSISLGVLAIMVQRRFGDWHSNQIGLAIAAVMLIVAASGYLVFKLPYALCVPFVAVAIVILTARSGRRTAIAKFMGGISYPLYLNHWMGLFAGSIVLKLANVAHTSAMIAGYIISIIIASVAYILVDQNIQKYRGKIYRPAYGYIAMISGYTLLALGLFFGLFLFGTLDGTQIAR